VRYRALTRKSATSPNSPCTPPEHDPLQLLHPNEIKSRRITYFGCSGSPNKTRNLKPRVFTTLCDTMGVNPKDAHTYQKHRGGGVGLETSYVSAVEKPLASIIAKENKNEWSGREDLNLRPPGPEPGALPGCATPRPARAGGGKTPRRNLESTIGPASHPDRENRPKGGASDRQSATEAADRCNLPPVRAYNTEKLVGQNTDSELAPNLRGWCRI
jgi:hypothetical protein